VCFKPIRLGVLPNSFDFLFEQVGMTIFKAAKDGDLATLSKLIEEGESVNEVNKAGNTPLTIAAGWGQTETVAFLLSKGANINHINSRGFSPLLMAVESGRTDTAFFLIDQGADISILTKGGQTASDLAHSSNAIDIEKRLIELGIPLHAETHLNLSKWIGAPEFSKTPKVYFLAGGHGCEEIGFNVRNTMKPGYTLITLNQSGCLLFFDKKIKRFLTIMETNPAKEKDTLEMLLNIESTFDDMKSAIDMPLSIYKEGMKYPNLFYEPLFDVKGSSAAQASGIYTFPLTKGHFIKDGGFVEYKLTGSASDFDSIYEGSIYPTVDAAKHIFNKLVGRDVERYKKALRLSITEIMDHFGPGTYFFLSCRVPSCSFEASNLTEKAYKLNVKKYEPYISNVPAHYETLSKMLGFKNANKPLVEKIRLTRQHSEEQQRAVTRKNKSTTADGGRRQGRTIRRRRRN
jgi:hypothetical protein